MTLLTLPRASGDNCAGALTAHKCWGLVGHCTNGHPLNPPMHNREMYTDKNVALQKYSNPNINNSPVTTQTWDYTAVILHTCQCNYNVTNNVQL